MDDRSPPGPTMLTREAPRTAPSGGAAHAVAPENGRALSLRVLLLALVLIPLNSYWIIQMERVRQGPYVTSISLFANVVFILLLFVAWNALLRRWQPRLGLRRGELLVMC